MDIESLTIDDVMQFLNVESCNEITIHPLPPSGGGPNHAVVIELERQRSLSTHLVARNSKKSSIGIIRELAAQLEQLGAERMISAWRKR